MQVNILYKLLTSFERKLFVVQSNLGLSKERLDKEQLGNSESFLMTNIPVHLINSEQFGFSEKLCDDQKVSYYQV